MMDLAKGAAFRKALMETGRYRTDRSAPRPLSARLLGRFDSWYYLNFAWIVFRGWFTTVRGAYDTEHWAAHSLDCLDVAEWCGGDVEITGMEHAFASRPTVYIGNHMSMLETILLPSLVGHPGGCAAVVKESLLRYPFFGKMLQGTGPISVGRKNPRDDLRAVLKDGEAALRGGRSVLLFPQATRDAKFDPNAFNSLGVKLAKAAGVKVTPLAVKTDFMRNGSLIKDIGPLDRSKRIHLRFGPPFAVSGNGREAHQTVIRFIQESLKEWAG